MKAQEHLRRMREKEEEEEKKLKDIRKRCIRKPNQPATERNELFRIFKMVQK